MRAHWIVLLCLGLLLPVAVAAQGRGRLDLIIVDKTTGKPVPCRIHLKDAAGKPVLPPTLPSWRDHFVSSGTVKLDLPASAYSYEVERGPEYSRGTSTVKVSAGGVAVQKGAIEHFADMPAEGWWAGDLHVHRAPADIELLMRAEDLHIAPVITWWNKKSQWASEKKLPKEPLVTFDKTRHYHLMAGEDEREGGALLYFNLKRPLSMLTATKEYPSPMKFLLEARKLMKDVWVDIEKPFWWDVPVWLASGMVDSIGLANNHMCRSQMYESEAWGKPRDTKRLPPPLGNGWWSQEIYYHILNTGMRLPPSAGSASGVLPNPVGYNRVYVQTGKELSYDKWWEGLRAGRVFVTNGPLLRVKAGGQWPGHVFSEPTAKEISIGLQLSISGREPISMIEIVQNGQVIRQVPFKELAKTGTVGGPVTFRSSGWFLVRALCDNDKTFRFASTGPFYVELGRDKQRISKTAAQFMLDWARERAGRIKLDDARQKEEVLRHHREAIEYWETKVKQANVE